MTRHAPTRGSHDPGRAGRRGPRRRGIALAVGLVVAGYAVVLGLTGIRDAASALADASLVPLGVAVLAAAAGVVALGMVQRASAASLHHDLRGREALNVSMTSFTVGQTVPGGSATAGAVAVHRLMRFGMPGPVATASFALAATLAGNAIAVIGSFGIGAAVLRGEVDPRFLLGAVAVLAVVAALLAVVLAVVRSRRVAERVMAAVSRLHHRLADRCDQWLAHFAGMRQHPPTPRTLLRILSWSALKWLADLAVLGLAFVAFDEAVTVTVVLVGFVVNQVAAAIPITPGGVGFVEGGMLSVFAMLGVAVPVATVVVLTYRVMVTWLPTLAGVPGLLRPPSPRGLLAGRAEAAGAAVDAEVTER